jgi:ATP-binding cassette, subfamily A (ABC1), member 3
MSYDYKDDPFWSFLLDSAYYIGLFVPPVCLLDILRKMFSLLPLLEVEPSTSIYAITSDEIGGNLIVLFVSGVLYLLLCILKDMNMLAKIYAFLDIKERKYPSKGTVDSDVTTEVDKVFSLSESDVAKKNLVAMKISKFYGNFLAVNQLSFCVEPGECFGLLVYDSLQVLSIC